MAISTPHSYTLYLKKLSGQALQAVQGNLFEENTIPHAAASAAFIRHRKANLKLSATGLNNFLDCRLKFYYENLAMLGSGKSAATVFGSAIHLALEAAFRHSREENLEMHICNVFYAHMQAQKNYFTEEYFELRLSEGKAILQQFLSAPFPETTAPEAAHAEIYLTARIQGIPLCGVVDKLEVHQNKVTITDYKTGRSPSNLLLMQPPNAHAPLGGKYWRQAIFYKILADAQPNHWQTENVRFHFLEAVPGLDPVVEIAATEASATTVLQQVRNAAEHLHNDQFMEGCGNENCFYCTLAEKDEVLPQIRQAFT